MSDRTGAAQKAAPSETAAASLAEARGLVRRVLGTIPVRVYLFGSRALGTSRATSDIDIGLLADDRLPDELVARLRDAFEESAIPYHVDVIDLARVDAGFRAKVLREGQPWDD